MKPINWKAIERLLVVRLDNIGDVVLLSPALRALRDAAPAAEITLMASPAGSQAAPLLPEADCVWSLRSVWQDASDALPFAPVRELALLNELRKHDFDAVVIFTSFSQTPFAAGYLFYLAGIPIRIGMSADFGGGVLTHQAPPPPIETHQAERNLRLLAACGLEVRFRRAALRVPEDARERLDAMLAAHGIARGEALVALVPGASAAARRYDTGRFVDAAVMAARKSSLPLVVLTSPREQELADACAERLGRESGVRSAVLAGETSVPELAAAIDRAALVLANNSLAIHLADAFGTPTVVTYSGTDLRGQWSPRSTPSRVLGSQPPCAPCYGFSCRQEGREHMTCLDIPPGDIADAAGQLLGIESGEMLVAGSR